MWTHIWNCDLSKNWFQISSVYFCGSGTIIYCTYAELMKSSKVFLYLSLLILNQNKQGSRLRSGSRRCFLWACRAVKQRFAGLTKIWPVFTRPWRVSDIEKKEIHQDHDTEWKNKAAIFSSAHILHKHWVNIPFINQSSGAAREGENMKI